MLWGVVCGPGALPRHSPRVLKKDRCLYGGGGGVLPPPTRAQPKGPREGPGDLRGPAHDPAQACTVFGCLGKDRCVGRGEGE